MGAASSISFCLPWNQETKKSENTPIVPEPATTSKDGKNFEYKDGIRFQNEIDVSYVLPNDYEELDRLQQQHWMFKYILKSNFQAPVADDLQIGINVLDAGCGPGTWSLDMAETYRESKFYGVDASAVFPENIKPKNVEFTVGNLAKSLPFSNDYFDYVFQRLISLGLKSEDWTNALAEHYRILKPEGYIELFEIDLLNHSNMGPLISKMHKSFLKLGKEANLNLNIAEELNDYLSKAGFTNITLKKFELKLNHTDKGGELFWEDFRNGLTIMRNVYAKYIPEWKDKDVFEKYADDCAKECKENKTSGYTVHVYTAQKPIA